MMNPGDRFSWKKDAIHVSAIGANEKAMELFSINKNTKEISLGNELLDNTRVKKLDYFQTNKD